MIQQIYGFQKKIDEQEQVDDVTILILWGAKENIEKVKKIILKEISKDGRLPLEKVYIYSSTFWKLVNEDINFIKKKNMVVFSSYLSFRVRGLSVEGSCRRLEVREWLLINKVKFYENETVGELKENVKREIDRRYTKLVNVKPRINTDNNEFSNRFNKKTNKHKMNIIAVILLFSFVILCLVISIYLYVRDQKKKLLKKK